MPFFLTGVYWVGDASLGRDFIIVTVNMACFDEPFYILAADNRAVVFVISFANNSYERTIPRITIFIYDNLAISLVSCSASLIVAIGFFCLGRW